MRLLLLVLVGCGRIAFDPIGGDDVAPTGDGGGSGSGDGGGSSMTDGAMPDALTACNNALTLQPLTSMAVSTCSGSDLLDGCGPAGTQEVVFKFVVPTTGGYNFRARDAGTQNVSNSTGFVNAGCTATVQCVGITSQPYTAGQVLYFAIEASSGGCANIEFESF